MKPKARIAALFAAAVMTGASGVSFSVKPPQAVESSGASSQAARAISHIYTGYIKTGNAALDRMSGAGLYGLGRQLYTRTGIENFYVKNNLQGEAGAATGQLLPAALDPAQDDLSVYSFIYWPIDPDRELPGKEAVNRLNDYMRGGGFLLIDTRDQATGGRGKEWLRKVLDRGLAIPALEKVEGCAARTDRTFCHALGKAFFLVKDFPGRQAGGDLWAERAQDYRDDGVASVAVGGNDWAAAWAMDAEGRYIVGDDAIGGAEQREKAYRAGINMAVYALTGNYKDDSVHLPAILKRIDRKPGAGTSP